jgi:putative oxidoreductase
MLCAIFLMAAVADNIPNFAKTVARMESRNIPSAKIMLIGAIVFLIAGSLMIILGYKGRFGALLLLVFLGLATYYFHDFWNDEATKDVELLHFMKNLGLAGAFVFILGNGTGAWSLGGRDNQSDEDFL